jgi:glutamyl-tRNA reductase
MASAAVELARKLYGSLSGRTVLVVGAGAMAELCARHLAGQSAKVWVANRTPEKARALCEAVGPRAEPRPFESLPALLAEADVVVTSTAAREPIFTVERVQAALKARKNRPLFLVDLAVPRDVDPAVQALDNVFTYDVDDLSRVVQDSLAARMQEARKAEVIVAEEAARFVRARAAREAVPVLAQLRQRAEGLARAEAEKTLAALGPGLTDKQKKSVEAMARAIVNKLLHAPTARLRTAGEEGPEAAARVAQAAAELFDLQPDSSPGREDA